MVRFKKRVLLSREVWGLNLANERRGQNSKTIFWKEGSFFRFPERFENRKNELLTVFVQIRRNEEMRDRKKISNGGLGI